MPSRSKAQARLMQAVAHNPAFAKKAGIPQSVGRDFSEADKKKGTKGLPQRRATGGSVKSSCKW
jgi:hypothetical protein